MQKTVWVLLFLLVAARVIIFGTTREFYPDGTKLRVSDRVLSEPANYERSQYVRLQGFSFYLPPYPEVNYGDYLVVEGRVEGNKLKDVRLVRHEQFQGSVFGLRKKLLNFYESAIPGDHSALIAGVTIGSKKNISTEFWERLKDSGTAHVVVASGMNVTLVCGFLMSFLVLILPRRKAIPFALAGVWVYAVLSGFDAPIVRAAIMGSVAFSAQQLGRLYIAWKGLVLSVLLMLVIKPGWMFDLGFILSFTATASLLVFERRVAKLVKFVPVLIRSDLSTAIAAQIGVAPILFVTYGQFNPWSPLINTFVIWTIAPMTIVGMVSGLLSFVSEPLARLVLLLTYPLTSWFIFVVKHTGLAGL